MDVLVTPDVLSFLEVISTSLQEKPRTQMCSLFAFSKDFIAVINSEELMEPDRFESLEIKTRVGSLQFRIHFDNHVRTESKHWFTKYSYEYHIGDEAVLEKWTSLLTFNHFQQMRKEERLPINSTTMNALKLKNAEARIWTNNEQRACVLHDISYSGARFFCPDDFIINSDQKTILQLSFIEPSEIATLRSVIIRSRCIAIGGIDCNEIAVRFLEPVDLVYLERMTACHQNMAKQYSFT